MLDLLRRFIALVSALAPGGTRLEFRAEWDAELAAAWQERRLGSWRDEARVMTQAVGSLPDAWFLFRQQWSLDMLLQDVRYALRLMRQRPGFTAIVVLTLALGIGANTAVFSVINAVLLRPLAFGEPGRILAIWENDRLNAKPRYPVAPANFKDWQAQARTFEQVAAFREGSATFTVGGEGVRAPGADRHHQLLRRAGRPSAPGRGLHARRRALPDSTACSCSVTTPGSATSRGIRASSDARLTSARRCRIASSA